MVFAGVVREEIKEEFYQLADELKEYLELKIYDDFVSFQVIEELCASSDYLLAPYENTGQSSGVIAYAAKYSIPVIGPAQGLLGKLIRRYHLGICLDTVDANGLKNLFQSEKLDKSKINTNYLKVNTISHFQESIFRHLNF